MSGSPGENVGLFVGKFGLPDKGLLCGISGLGSICRVCRVLLGVESLQEFGDFPKTGIDEPQIIQNVGLE
jgi:hypothetical protein